MGPGPFVLVHGWPASGKSTLAAGLATVLGLPLLAKDEVKEVLADALGRPADVEASRLLGRAAAHAVLTVAARCPGAVLDSSFLPDSWPLVRRLAGPVVEVRCLASLEVVRARFAERAASRHDAHLDLDRSEAELWGTPVDPLGLGRVVDVDTTRPVDPAVVAARVRALV